MADSSYRTLRLGLALAPALCLLLLPQRLLVPATPTPDATPVLAAIWVAGVAVVAMLLRSRLALRARQAPLMSRRALRRMPCDQASLKAHRARLEALHDTANPLPEVARCALCRTVARTMASWGRADLAELTPAELVQLGQFVKLVNAPPERAGALAQQFLTPHLMLEIRDRIAALAAAKPAR